MRLPKTREVDNCAQCGYNVTTMTTIKAKLIKDGNSTALRLPKVILDMSGLHDSVLLEAKKGQIVIKQEKNFPRKGWKEQIDKILAEEAHIKDDDFSDMNKAGGDGLSTLPWDGPSYEEWQKQNAKK